MKLYELAKRIANFVWDCDPYEARDNYDTIGELISETLIGLSNKPQRIAIANWLRDCETEPNYAKELAREVRSL